MSIVLFIVACLAFPAFYLLLCGLWAVWLALGRTPMAARVPIFLVGAVLLGLVPSSIETGRESAIYFCVFFAIAVASAAVMERNYIYFSLFCLLVGGLFLAADPLFWNRHQSSWFTTMTIALCLLAAIISVIRPMGFRMIRFTADAISQEIEAASGRDIDQWITMLDREGAESWNFSELIIYLRQYGFDYRWQKAIAIAYEKSLGRRSIETTFEGRPQRIGSAVGDPQNWLSELTLQRFTIVNMFLWSVAAAAFFGFFRLVGQFEVTTDQAAYGLPFVLAMAALTLSLLQRCLGMRDRIPGILILVGITLISILVPRLIGFVPSFNPMYLLVLSSLLGYPLWLYGALMLVRKRGYRLVRLQTMAG